MKSREGFALVLVLCVASVLSICLLQAYRRASLLIRTVAEREQSIMRRSYAEALMQYALYMAKHNWDFIMKQAKKGAAQEYSFDWGIGKDKACSAVCSYASAIKNQLIVEVSLQQKNSSTTKLSCKITKTPEGKMLISSWKEGSPN